MMQEMLLIVLFITLSSLFYYFIIINIIDVIVMGPFKLRYYKNVQGNVMIDKKNRVDLQTAVECAGYSSAYILRHLGIEADGKELYQELANKTKNGYVYPKEILKIMKSYNIKTHYCRGNLNSLKHEINKGNPVIVFIRSFPRQKWLHFVPVVGMDQQYVYLSESLKEFINVEDNSNYNRRIPIKEFLNLWNTSMLKMPCYAYTYFCFENNPNI
jgi:hypothetical protein